MFSKEVRDAAGLDVSKWQYYRARKKALEKIRGSTERNPLDYWTIMMQ